MLEKGQPTTKFSRKGPAPNASHGNVATVQTSLPWTPAKNTRENKTAILTGHSRECHNIGRQKQKLVPACQQNPYLGLAYIMATFFGKYATICQLNTFPIRALEGPCASHMAIEDMFGGGSFLGPDKLTLGPVDLFVPFLTPKASVLTTNQTLVR